MRGSAAGEGTGAEAGVVPSNGEATRDEIEGGQLPSAALGLTGNGVWATANRARHNHKTDNLKKVRCMYKFGSLLYI